MKNYSNEVPALTSAEKRWIKRLERCLKECPTDRIVLQTIGDANLTVIDGNIVKKYCIDTSDGGAFDQGVDLAIVESKPPIWGVSG